MVAATVRVALLWASEAESPGRQRWLRLKSGTSGKGKVLAGPPNAQHGLSPLFPIEIRVVPKIKTAGVMALCGMMMAW
jgi:hypothetical protein